MANVNGSKILLDCKSVVEGAVKNITGGEKVENLILKDIRLGWGRRADSVSSTGRRQPLLQGVTMTTPCHCLSDTASVCVC